MAGATTELFGQMESRVFQSDAEFRECLFFESDLASVLQHDNLYVIVTLLGFSDPGVLRRALLKKDFNLEAEQGSVWRISHAAVDPEVANARPFEAHVGLDWQNGLAVYYTNFRKTAEIDRLLIPTIERTSTHMGLFVMYPHLIHRMLDALFERYPEARLTEFTARTPSSSSPEGTTRPGVGRTVQYWGNDGRDTYPELRDTYGTAISRAALELPSQDTKLRLSQTGVVAFCNGDPSIFSLILDEYVLPEARTQRDLVYRARRQTVKVGPRSKRRELPVVVPLRISLNEPLRYYETKKNLSGALENNGFQVLAFMASEGSLFLKAALFDSKRMSRFDIWANEDSIRVLPGEHTRLSTLLRFYDFVLSDVDPNAVLGT